LKHGDYYLAQLSMQHFRGHDSGTPTYPAYDVTRPLLDDLVGGLNSLLEKNELGAIYLGGSLALGGFDPARSDLDFVVVLANTPTDQQTDALREMHARIRRLNRNALYSRYEGVYLSCAQARWPQAEATGPQLGRDGDFTVRRFGPGLTIDLWRVRRHGITVLGQPPVELVGLISNEQMVAAKVDLFNEWWLPRLNARKPLSARFQVYATLTMARILYGIANNDEVSKPAAAEWLARTSPHFSDLLYSALAWREPANLDRQEDVYELMEFVQEKTAQM
jgi:hypothetical protein